MAPQGYESDYLPQLWSNAPAPYRLPQLWAIQGPRSGRSRERKEKVMKTLARRDQHGAFVFKLLVSSRGA